MREFGPIISGSFAPNRQPKLTAPINEDSGGRSISHNKYLKMILIGLGSTFASSVNASNDLYNAFNNRNEYIPEPITLLPNASRSKAGD
jgi:hypothetical protein